MRKIVYSIIISGLLVSACKSREPISGFYQYDTECLGKSATGIQVLKAWGTGINLKEAQRKAYQAALNEVLFKGIRNGNPDCELVPLVTEANAQEKYATYFQEFFSNRGMYEDFVNLYENETYRRNKRSNHKEAFPYVVEVDVPGLREQLRTDNIIK